MGAKKVLEQIREELEPAKQALGQAREKAEPVRQVLGQAWDLVKPAFDHGRSEMAAALFSGSAYVMYQRSEPGLGETKGLSPEGIAPEGLAPEGSTPDTPAPEGLAPELANSEKALGMNELRALARATEAARGNEPERDTELEL